MKKQVAITGMGIICAAGSSPEELARNLFSGGHRFTELTDSHLSHLRAKYAGLVKEIPSVTDAPGLDDRYLQLAAYAARGALEQSRIRPSLLGNSIGIILATCSGPMRTIENHYRRILEGNAAVDETGFREKRYDYGVGALARAFNIGGLSTTVSTACSASTCAAGVAADLIRQGQLEAVLVGGSDSFSPTTLVGFDGLKATSQGVCAPFSHPIGLVLGEAGAFLMLEDADRARRRGASILGIIHGYGSSNDAYHCSAPDPSGRGQALAIKRALENAGCVPEKISYVNAHGTGTTANDKSECRALSRVFGSHLEQIGVSSTKSVFGHCLGAAGIAEIISTLAGALNGFYPPTANFTGLRDGCVLDTIPNVARPRTDNRPFLNNNFAFGGHNASVVVQPGDVPISSSASFDNSEEVFITGCGAVTPAGIGIDSLLRMISKNRSSISSGRTAQDSPLKIPAFQERDFDRRLNLRNMDNAGRYASVAVKLALQEGRYPDRPKNLTELGFYMAQSSAPVWAEEEHITGVLSHNYHVDRVHAFPCIVPNSVAGNVSRALSIQGHNAVFCGGPGAGHVGAGLAEAAIRAGHADSVICASSDELSAREIADMVSAGLIAPKMHGVPAEGAAALLIERGSRPDTRSISPVAKICGTAYGTERNTDPKTYTDGLVKVMEICLKRAGIGPSDIDVVCCRDHDRVESAAVGQVFSHRQTVRMDVSGLVGVAEASFPLVNLCSALFSPTIADMFENYYILSLFASRYGVMSTLVCRRITSNKL